MNRILIITYIMLLFTHINTSNDHGFFKLRRPFKLQRAPSSNILLNETHNKSLMRS